MMIAASGIQVTDTASLPFLLAAATGVGAFANKLLGAWQAKAATDSSARVQTEQIEQVDGPRAKDAGWAAFAAAIQTNADAAADRMLREMEKQREHFEDRLADLEGQILALRTEVENKTGQLAQKDNVIREREITIRNRDLALEQRDGVIQRLRAHAALLANLVHRLGGELPEFHDDPTVAPERREPTIAMPATTTIVEKDHSPRTPIRETQP